MRPKANGDCNAIHHAPSEFQLTMLVFTLESLWLRRLSKGSFDSVCEAALTGALLAAANHQAAGKTHRWESLMKKRLYNNVVQLLSNNSMWFLPISVGKDVFFLSGVLIWTSTVTTEGAIRHNPSSSSLALKTVRCAWKLINESRLFCKIILYS